MEWVWRILGGLAALVVLCVLALFVAGYRSGAGTNSVTGEIARPAAQVWRWITEDALLRKWITGLDVIRTVSGDGKTPGSKLYLEELYEGQRAKMEMTLTAFEPERRIAFTLVGVDDPSAGFTEQAEYILVEQNGRTRLTLSGATVYHGFVPRLFEPLITPAAQKKLESDLAKLKQLVEAAPPAAPQP